MKVLYKKDSKGKIRTLKIYTSGAKLMQESGVLNEDGEINAPVIHEKLCKAKNVGKVNATTPAEQATAEMEAKYNIKITEGYFKTIEEAQNEKVIMPMLAKDYKKESSKINWNGDVFIQPKLDGMRCLAIVKDGDVTLISRKGKDIDTMDHICKELKNLPNCILDGELYAHGKTFQENMKLIKKYRAGESEIVSYHIYDMVENISFALRYSSLKAVLKESDTIKSVETMRLTDPNGIKPIHAKYLSDGYEGSMIRHGSDPYRLNNRADQLLKYKDFKDITCKILDIEPADARPEWGTPVCEYNGHVFKAGTKMSHDERKELLINKSNYIGETAEIRYFEETDDGLPRFPVMVGIRLDK